MNDAVIALVPAWGAWLVLGCTFLSCLAIPIPAGLAMLAAGAFVASGDLTLASVAPAAFGGAILGDQAGYAIGRRGAALFGGDRSRTRRTVIAKARAALIRWRAPAVFLTRWLFSPLGPYVNFVAGASGVGWAAFTVWSALGEAIWVGGYIALGYAFSDQIGAVAVWIGDMLGVLAGAAATLGLGALLWRHAGDQMRAARSRGAGT